VIFGRCSVKGSLHKFSQAGFLIPSAYAAPGYSTGYDFGWSVHDCVIIYEYRTRSHGTFHECY